MSWFADRFREKAAPALDRVFGWDATYVRGTDRFDVRVRLHTQDGERIESNIVVETKQLVALISRSAKPFLGTVDEPRRGDQVIIEFQNRISVYELMAGPGEQYSDDQTPDSDFKIFLVRREHC